MASTRYAFFICLLTGVSSPSRKNYGKRLTYTTDLLYNKSVVGEHMITNRVGSPVRGEDFYGRESFVELIWQKLKLGNILLAAPRRFGKTSVMYHLIDNPRWDYRLVHAD